MLKESLQDDHTDIEAYLIDIGLDSFSTMEQMYASANDACNRKGHVQRVARGLDLSAQLSAIGRERRIASLVGARGITEKHTSRLPHDVKKTFFI